MDSILTPEERGQSYSWSMAESGDYVYIGTCFNSTYYQYYYNVYSAVNTMKTNGTISSDVDASKVAEDFVQVAFGEDAFDTNWNPRNWTPVIMAVNKHTGEAEVIFREKDIIAENKQMFPYGMNALSGYRMAFEFKGKIYFAGMGNPTATLVEVDPNTNEAKIVYYNIIKTNSQTTKQYGAVSNGVHGLLVFDDEILMCLATDDLNGNGVCDGEDDIGGIIVGSTDPSAGLSSWRRVASQSDFDNLPAVMQRDGLNGGGIWDLIEYNGALYVTMVTDRTDKDTGVTNKQGFALYRGDKQADDSFVWTQLAGDNDSAVLPFGFGINYSMTCNMWVYDNYLYFGTYNDPMMDLAAVGASGNFEPLYYDLDHSIYLYRMDQNGSIEMIGGKDDNPEFPDGPIGNLGEGLGNNSNQYVWRYGEHNGELYIGTYDTSTLTYIFTQLTDGQVAQYSDEELNSRAKLLEKVLLEVLQENDNELLKTFLERSVFSGTAQKLFRSMSGGVSGLTADWNPVDDYKQTLANYEALKKLVYQAVDMLALTNDNDVSSELSDADLDSLMLTMEEAASELESPEDAALTVDDFLESLSDEEVAALYQAAFPDETEDAGTAEEKAENGIAMADLYENDVQTLALPSISAMREKLKAALNSALDQLFEKTDELFYSDDLHNIIYYFGVNYYAQQAENGFDLLVSNDGVNFDAITRDGFGDGYNHGLRTIGSTEQGVYMGTANPFQATQLWRMYSDEDLPLDSDPTATHYNITVRTEGNGSASASQTSAVEGKYVTLTAAPDEGASFQGWRVESPEGLEISDYNTFRMPGQDVTIVAVFTGNTTDPADPKDPGTADPAAPKDADTPASAESAAADQTAQASQTGQTKTGDYAYPAAAAAVGMAALTGAVLLARGKKENYHGRREK